MRRTKQSCVMCSDGCVTCRSFRNSLSPSRATTLWAPAFSSVFVNTPGPKKHRHKQNHQQTIHIKSHILHYIHINYTSNKCIPGLHSKIRLLVSSGRRCCVTNSARSGSTMKCRIFLQARARRLFSSTSPSSRKSYRHGGRRWSWKKTGR